jgi:hypothetical protein
MGGHVFELDPGATHSTISIADAALLEGARLDVGNVAQLVIRAPPYMLERQRPRASRASEDPEAGAISDIELFVESMERAGMRNVRK